MKCLFVVRLLFSSLVPATVIIAYPVFVFVCDFSSDDHECARSEHAVAVFGATLAVCLPAAVVFVAGWGDRRCRSRMYRQLRQIPYGGFDWR